MFLLHRLLAEREPDNVIYPAWYTRRRLVIGVIREVHDILQTYLRVLGAEWVVLRQEKHAVALVPLPHGDARAVPEPLLLSEKRKQSGAESAERSTGIINVCVCVCVCVYMKMWRRGLDQHT